jgi:anti-sigma regulatory factor (Ser/Thr protein kinase)
MREIALHILDIAENSVAAQARNISISVCEDLGHDRLTTIVEDDGIGMDAETIARVTDPFFTSRTARKVGLGIPLFKAAAEACNGDLKIHSVPGIGTCIKTDFQRNHIDRMPLGDLPGTILTLVVAYPQIHWRFEYQAWLSSDRNKKAFLFDDQTIKEELEGLSLCEPRVLAFLRDYLEEGVVEVQSAIQETETNKKENMICPP